MFSWRLNLIIANVQIFIIIYPDGNSPFAYANIPTFMFSCHCISRLTFFHSRLLLDIIWDIFLGSIIHIMLFITNLQY